ncbi:Squalene/phytoene synthase [Parasponia andersonii]|uniref:Squalene/phytoene synthase n=1 Tax=Parasponia andersonii TaxID=3476 RepID=A0A2P5AY82_PARAD|nr:Squalene/phytoene synthase [Parasponia andersonii]
MAVHQFSSVDVSTSFGRIGVGLSRSRGRGGHTSSICPVQCVAFDHAKTSSNGNATIHSTSINDTIARQSANYEPPVWGFDYIQSTSSDNATSNLQEEGYRRRVNKLKEEVKVMLTEKVAGDSLAQLELIDTLQRLGVSYHFDNDIDTILRQKYANKTNDPDLLYGFLSKTEYFKVSLSKGSSHNTRYYFAQSFKHNCLIEQRLGIAEVFNVCKDEAGNFKACMSNDIMGILSSYEASFHLKVLWKKLKNSPPNVLKNSSVSRQSKLLDHDDDDDLGLLVSHALELPLHWRMLRLEARWFIDVYEKRQDKNSTLLEFAKLDLDMVQLTHQKDLKHVSRWWKHNKLRQKLNFARDRLIEYFLWTVGFTFEPQFTYGRRMTTKVNTLITVIDDIYDVYGTLEELELFIDAVERWDLNAIDYMKICFFVLHNSINEMVFDVLKEQEFLNIKYFKKSMLFTRGKMVPQWIHTNLARIYFEFGTSYPHALLFPSYKSDNRRGFGMPGNLFQHNSLNINASKTCRRSRNIIKVMFLNQFNATCTKLAYEARQHIKYLISETWKQLNEDRVAESCFSHKFVQVATNLARMALCLYQHGDGHTSQDCHSKERISALLINPIPLSNP